MNVAPSPSGPSGRWDVAAIRAGIGVCLLLAIPLTIVYVRYWMLAKAAWIMKTNTS